MIRPARLAAAATFVDPVSLRTFARQLRERFAPDVPPRTMTADDYLRHDPQLPRAVAEHYAAEANRHADPTSRLPAELRGVTSVEAIRRQIEGLAVDGRISNRALEVRSKAGYADSYQYVAIGVVDDGDRIAHILYRADVDPAQPWSGDIAKRLASQPAEEQVLARQLWAYGSPSVATIRRQTDGTWRFVVEHDFLRVGSIYIGGVRVQENESDAEGESPPA